MSIGRFTPVLVREVAVTTTLAFALVAAPPARAASYSWNNIAGGSAATATNWSPNGVPGALDDVTIGLPANYAVVWASPADTLQSLTVNNAQPSFTVTGRLGVRFHPVIGNNGTLILFAGRVDGPSWSMVANNANGSLQLTGPTSQALALAPSTTSLFGARGGSAFIDIADGATFQSAGEISLGPNLTSLIATVRGNHAGQPSLLSTTTTGVPGQGWIAIGDYGSATVDLSAGARLRPSGDLFVGRHSGSSGLLELLTDLGVGPVVDARSQIFIGANDEVGAPGGTAVLDARLGKLAALGRCWLGDPDDSPPADPSNPSARLLVQGANLALSGGLTMSAAGSGRLEFRSGAIHVLGGTVDIRQATPFALGTSGGSSPVLYLENGTTNDIWATDANHAALGLGRGGHGTLNLAGAGTTLTIHGALVMADSTGGNGVLSADSASTAVVQGRLAMSGVGSSQIIARGVGTTLTLQDSVAIGAGGTQQAVINATASATVHLQKGATIAGVSSGGLYCFLGAQVDAAGITTGPVNGGVIVGLNGAALTVSDHLDLTGASYAEADEGGTLSYTNAARAATVAPDAVLIVSDGSLVHIAGELDVRGLLNMEPTSTSGLTSGAPGYALARSGDRHPAREHVTALGTGGRLECPLARLIFSGRAIAVGTIAGRFHIDSGLATLQISYDDQYFTGRLVAGDSTKSDGFLSVGTTHVGADTLKVLDSDGGDLGKVYVNGGDLQLPKPGHLRSGTLLSGYGTVDGSLDVRDSAWVSFQGQVSGDIALAGTLDLGPAIAGLVVGSLHPAATGRTTLKIGHTAQDLIIATGPAVLAGTLDLRTVTGDLPAVGDTFTVMLGGPVSGTFANVRVNGQPAASVAHVLYRANDVRVAMVGAVAGVGDPPALASPGELRFVASGGPRASWLALDLPVGARVRVTLFDVSGRQVAMLADGEEGAGRHRYELTGRVGGSGVYFARAEVRGAAGARVLTTRAVVLR